MKKTWKRLCTGFLALATVVTALPTTPVHAESKQYWTESKERVGIVEKVMNAVRDLLTYYDAEQTAFSIINQYVRFVDEEPDKRKNDWKLNDRWAWFIGDNRQSLKLTTKPEPYTLDRTLRWVQRQVAPTLKMLKKIDKGNGTDYMETIEQQAKLTEKHEMIIKQQTTPAKDLVES